MRVKRNFPFKHLSKHSKPPPSEEEVRRFFHEAYYTSMTYDSESGDVRVNTDRTGLIYPKKGDAL